MKQFIYPTFGIDIKSYDGDNKIELSGSNNWYTLVFTHLLMIVLTIIVLMLAYNFMWDSIFIRGGSILLLYLVGSFSYKIFKDAQGPNYMNKIIRFDEKGIYLGQDENANSGKMIKAERINKLKIISDGVLFKFFLFGRTKPSFEFSISSSKSLNPEKLIEDISKLLKLEIREGADIGTNFIFELIKNQEALENSNEKTRQFNQKSENYATGQIKNEYKPKLFYSSNKNDHFVIIARHEEDRIEPPQKFWISIKDKIIWHKKMLVIKEEFAFSDISNIEYEIGYRSGQNMDRYMEGKLYLVTKNNKRNKIFSIDKIIKGQQELIEFEMLKDLEHLIKIIEAKTNYKCT